MAFPVNAQRITPRQITPRDEKERVGSQPQATKDGDPKTSVGVAAFARKDGPQDQGSNSGGSNSGQQGGTGGRGQTLANVQVQQNVAGGAPVGQATQVTQAQAAQAADQVVRTNTGAAGVPSGWQRYMPHMLGKPIRIRGPVPSEFASQIQSEMNLARIQHRAMNRDHVASGRYDRIP
ncbi:MAG: hypothetical protein HY791_04405 [Deltaproteobacteria bacterium]|nr:hypothetical protein [Deltaproteobacteria bacterium]